MGEALEEFFNQRVKLRELIGSLWTLFELLAGVDLLSRSKTRPVGPDRGFGAVQFVRA